MISPTVFYLIFGIITFIAFSSYFAITGKFNTATLISTIICGLVCSSLFGGLIYLIDGTNDTVAWVVAVLLLLCQIGGNIAAIKTNSAASNK